MVRLWNLVLATALIVLAVACSPNTGELTGTRHLVSYVDDGTEIVIEEGVNTTVPPIFRFDGQHVMGNAGCNNFGDDDDYPYTYADGVLNLGVLVKDASECETMNAELFLEDVIWSGSDISVVVDNQAMTWGFGGDTLTFTKVPDSASG